MVAPGGLVGSLRNGRVDQPEHQAELGVIDADDQQAAGVMAASRDALADEPSEVLDVGIESSRTAATRR